jgi:hypothetical protein
MKISVNNYQEFAAEWLDGTLPRVLNEAFEAFLDTNPLIREELEEIRELDQNPITDPLPPLDASSLKRTIHDKTINANNFLEFVMAEMDHELDAATIGNLHAWLETNPQHQREAKLFAHCVIKPEQTEVFPYKLELKKETVVPAGEISAAKLEELVIAFLEDDLDEESRRRFVGYTKSHPEAEALLKQFKQVMPLQDDKMKFPDKSSLKQRNVVVMSNRLYFIRTIAVAASIALMAGIFLLDRNPDLPDSIPAEASLASVIKPHLSDPVTLPGINQALDNKKPKHQANRSSQPNIVAVQALQPVANPGTRQEEVTMHQYPIRTASEIQIASLGVNMLPRIAPADLIAAAGHQAVPPRKLTIEEFPIDQIRYFTGGGNERPGLLAEISVSRIIEVANPYDRINNAGQQLFTRFAQWKERTLDEVIPYR